MAQSQGPELAWVMYALMTVVAWGVYGIFIHQGQVLMGDPASARYKSFLFVGLAYVLVAVFAPVVALLVTGASWSFSGAGVAWSLLAGIMGAVGAFCVLLAFGAKGSPAAVMSIIFAGAPVVNATVALLMHPPAGGFASIRPQFYLGILLAALGGFLVTIYKPGSPPAQSKPPAASRQAAADSQPTPGH